MVTRITTASVGLVVAAIMVLALSAGPAAATLGGGGGGEAVSCSTTYATTWYTGGIVASGGGCPGNVATWSVRIPGDTCATADVYRAEVWNPAQGEWFMPYRDDQPYCTNGTTYQSKYDSWGNVANQQVYLYISAGCGCRIATTAYVTITIYRQ